MAGGWSTCSTSGSARRRSLAGSSAPTTGSSSASDVDADAVAAAAQALLAAPTLPRVRSKGESSVPYDLRPLLADVVDRGAGPPVALRVRGRIHPELGVGRPEEVIAALGDALGRALEVRGIVRERLILADDA